ncbi:UMTA protein [Colletotrichum orchidophilum]|uniref:UMTA protein n=1 Tax=Colletotrichum orchidophilum TaxID=1209926 RepID=A0A1G4BAE5_9PEZI|nr:UMTA protein [Colletotrichum orchidophilum]OHE98262.1 UMTA protein [Colletotrichum orchidophilum]
MGERGFQEIANMQWRIETDTAIGHGDGEHAPDTPSSYTSTTSISSSILDYRQLHGRTYQNSKTGEYWAPNDQKQNEGLDLIHNALLMLLDNRLSFIPIDGCIGPERVLDVGTGTGIWAMDFGDQYPTSKVIGTDLSPIQPSWVPPNVEFILDDCTLNWVWPENHFDFIHLRSLYGSIPDWRALYNKVFSHLKPGGWIQSIEMEIRIKSDHVDFPADHIFNRWADMTYEAGEKMGRTFTICQGQNIRNHLQEIGFVDIVEQKTKAPLHGWPSDPKLREAGQLFQIAFDESLNGFGMYLFTQVLGWTREEVDVLISEMREESRKKANCHWFEV